ncbi:MAG: P-loop NTPase [Ignavibacteria bacterium]
MIGQAERLVELNKLKANKQKPHNGGQIVAFSSGKGGTGKTFISLNTAYSLAKFKKKILLIDLDANLSNINIMLNIKAERTLINFFKNINSLKDLIMPYDRNISFIFGDSGRVDYPFQSEKDLDLLLGEIWELSKEFDYIFLDIGAGASDDIIYILKNIHTNILIINPEPTSIMDAYVIVKLLNNAGSVTKNLVVVNKCFNENDGNAAFENISNAAKHFLHETVLLLGIVLNDQSVTRMIMAQELYLKKLPGTQVSMSIMKIAQTLVQRHKLTSTLSAR